MDNQERRNFLKTGSGAVAALVFGALAARVNAAEHGGGKMADGEKISERNVKDREVFVVKAAEEGVCATCAYWGGIRKLSGDGQNIECESTGWCNNRKSRFFGMRTTPRTGPMASWKKWDLS